MSQHTLQQPIEDTWERRDTLSSSTKGEARDAVEAALDALDSGEVRVAEKGDVGWQVNQWLKKAVLMSFRLTDFDADGRPRGRAGVGQGADEVRWVGREPIQAGRISGGSRGGSPAVGVYCAGSGA